ncbi:hypothetical protein [Paraliomyxa miuraensis]|uniref:hypothetical protein n=1 Tax=Paraliomyxa miuraensis TaxID=376150 RepID=UPI00225B8DBD|nr:hypothetical protein [Paraliomyxa miuraensis]MCX4245146.1 hypothetical protein [Paraliomyxa miuraensis]
MPDDLYVTSTGMTVDPGRIKRQGETLMFAPFTIERTAPLADALADQTVPPDAELLLATHDDDHVLALSRQQMAYHHVAQGTVEGKPWLVFF